MADQPLFHLALAGAWAQAQEVGRYERSTIDRSLAEEGFVHCSFAVQVPGTAARFYADRDDVVLLRIDPGRLGGTVVVEDLHGSGIPFPHVYGPIPVSAVVSAVPVPLGDGVVPDVRGAGALAAVTTSLVERDDPSRAELVGLYGSVGWSAYTDDPASLERAVAGSTFVVGARDGDSLVGLARVVSDDVSIAYLQDLLVTPTHQSHGLGAALLHRCLDRFAHVRQRVLLTDGDLHAHRLYRSAGFRDVAAMQGQPLHAFVSIRGDRAEVDPTDTA